MSQFSEDLRTLRLHPSSGLSDDDFVARVMAACEAAPETATESTNEAARRRRLERRAVSAYGIFIAAAACVVGVAVWPRRDMPVTAVPGTVAARGNSDAGLAATVQAFVGHTAPGSAAPLLEGAVLHPGDGILVRYSNPSASNVYLMVFALDQQRSVHWIHPAYLDEKSNPTSIKLDQSVTDQVLSEVAEPENPAPGRLEVYAILSGLPLDVKSVESKLTANQRPVPELFPQAEVEEWRCTWSAR